MVILIRNYFASVSLYLSQAVSEGKLNTLNERAGPILLMLKFPPA